jgi:hypothetical protein
VQPISGVTVLHDEAGLDAGDVVTADLAIRGELEHCPTATLRVEHIGELLETWILNKVVFVRRGKYEKAEKAPKSRRCL